MGKTGPKPKPTALRVLHGDRKDRINDNEPVPAEADVAAPEELSEEARAIWDRLAPDLIRLGVLTAWDVDAFAITCEALARYRAATRLVNGSALLVQGPNGLIKNPALMVQREAEVTFAQYGARFGLTPSDRSQLKVDTSGAGSGSGASSRSRAPRLPECGFTLDGRTCRQRGDHFCRPRAAHAVAFCQELCRHTKDKWARRPFLLARWQRRDIIEPLFGTVAWDPEWESYVRRYQIAWLEVARKNGKSELLAFIALYLLVADGVEGAEIYGCAIDRAQASKVFDVAARMVRLSPELSRRLVVKDHIKRIIDERTGSFYEVVAADAAGNLGHNPSGVIFDEVLTQRDSSLWDAMRTGMGTRAQPLIVAATTAGDDPASVARSEHDECVRIIDDPDRAQHRFAYIRNVPEDADPWDERNWPLANPALGDFLSIRALRQEAAEAQNDPSKENAFRQYRLNQWVQQAHRWMPMHLYRRCAGTVAPAPDWLRVELAGRRAYAGLDLAAKLDMTAWALIVPDGLDGVASMLWRFWLPDAAVTLLDKRTNGRVSQWADDGWITVTPGDVIDYDVIYADIADDCATFKVMAAGYDDWSGEPVRQAIQKRTRLDLAPIPQTYRGLTYGMTELMALTKSRSWTHHANPVAEWCFDAVEVRHPPGDADQLRPDKPDRNASSKRIDAVPTAAMAVTRWRELAAKHARSGRMVVR